MVGAADALHVLAGGQSPAREVAEEVGWGLRTGGSRMRSLELQGFVNRVVVKEATPRGAPKHEWLLTAKGWNMIGVWNVPVSEEVRRRYAGTLYPPSRRPPPVERKG